ncbi:MAG: hypothetical protein Q4D98_02810 [Planctomycetia bacterium]|nr:hypothetical protein [Planctomycetia bacterium]
MKRLFWLGILLVATEVFAEKPVILWSSSPVSPGETALLFGDGFGEKPTVTLTCGGQTETVTPQSVSPNAVTFVVPQGFPKGWISGEVKNGENAASFTLNHPKCWWIQGDQGRTASSVDGEFFCVGECLDSMAKNCSLVFLREGKEVLSFPHFLSNACLAYVFWSIEIPTGEYTVVLRNDDSKEVFPLGKIQVVPKKSFWKEDVFDVTAFGAVANDGIDDTPAILAAVEKLTENDGGVLFFPCGRFQMTETIALPPYSVVRGACGEDNSFQEERNEPQTEIYWPDTYEPPEALIRGTHAFGVEDIFLTCGFHQDGIVSAPADAPEAGNIRIHRVTLRMLYSQYVNDSNDERSRRLNNLHYTRALRLAGENVQVTDSDIYCAAGGVFELNCTYSRFQRNALSCGNIVGWNGFQGQNLLFLWNRFGGANCTSFYGRPDGSENIYWRNNTHENTFDGNNRETITGDGRVHAYKGLIENITPRSFTLITDGKPMVWPRFPVEVWQRGAVQIVGGKGVGQFRRIQKIDGNQIVLERPWDILPDANSVINIGSFRRHFVYTENLSYDSTVSLQFYGSMLESLFFENHACRTGGWNADAMTGETGWFNQFFNNTHTCGNSYRGPRNEVPPTDAQLGLLAYGDGNGKQKYPLIRGCVVRNNELLSNAKIHLMGGVEDCVLEGNAVSNSDQGIVISGQAKNIVLRNNTFCKVRRPYVCSRDSVVLDEAEAWESARDAVIWELNLPPEETAELDRWAMLRYVSEKYRGKRLTAECVANLTGMVVRTVNWTSLEPLMKHGQAGKAGLYLSVSSNCSVAGKWTAEVRPEDFPVEGWKFTYPEATLEPGKEFSQNLMVEKPEGKARFVAIPVTFTLSGDGWTLSWLQKLENPWENMPLESWQVSPTPFLGPNGTMTKMGYVPYEKLPPSPTLVPAILERGMFQFTPFFKPQDDGKLLYAVTKIVAKRPIRVRFQYDACGLLYVNGKLLGTAQNRGSWGFITLREGENRVEWLLLPNRRHTNGIPLPRITWAENVLPGELEENHEL